MKNAGETKQGNMRTPGYPKQRRRVASVASDLQAEADSLRRQRDNAVRFDRNCQHSRVSERKFRIWKHLWKFTEVLEAEDCFFLLRWFEKFLRFPWHHVLLPCPMCIVDGVQVHRCGASVGSFRCYSVAARLGPCTETAHDQSRWTTTCK